MRWDEWIVLETTGYNVTGWSIFFFFGYMSYDG
jgi:hypothetical protein